MSLPEVSRLLDAISRAIEAQGVVMRDELAALVSVASENPPGTNYAPCVDLLCSMLAAADVPYERIDVPTLDATPRTAIRAWIGEGSEALTFHGHYDVVPATTPSQFRPRVEGDALFGRGSSDMKGGLVAMLHAAVAVRTVGAPLRGRIELLFVPDEETGGTYGSAALAESGQLGTHSIGMLLPEPTSGVIWNANRGAITLEVTVRGRAAHVGLMRDGVNAVSRAMPLLTRLFALDRELEARQGSIMLVGGRVEAGDNFNVVPSWCRFTIDRRLDPGEDFEAEKARLMALIDEARRDGSDLSVRVIQQGHASATPADVPLARALARSVEAVTGTVPAFRSCPGLLEIRFYAERGVPALAYGPGVLAVSHGPKEFVKISRMIECAKIYALTAFESLARE